MNKLSYNTYVEVLLKLGLKDGDTVFVQSDLGKIGPLDVDTKASAYLHFYFHGIQDVVGVNGTIVVMTANDDWGYKGEAFYKETSPSHRGRFSEYIRRKPESVRSLHPASCVSALGEKADFIANGAHYDAYGYDSPYGRMHKLNAKILSIGFRASSFNHYAESLYGVPYRYYKMFKTPVYSKNEQVEGPFTMLVKYSNYGLENTPDKINSYLTEKGVLKECKLGKGKAILCSVNDYVDNTIVALRKDRFILQKYYPAFEEGKIPLT